MKDIPLKTKKKQKSQLKVPWHKLQNHEMGISLVCSPIQWFDWSHHRT